MKFLLTNPETLIRERDLESSYGKGRRISLGMGSEYDRNTYSRINTAIGTYQQDNSQPLDLAEVFLYSPKSQGSKAVRDELSKFFDIIKIEKQRMAKP